MAGYSGTPLPKKLGIGEGAVVALSGAPDDFTETLGALPHDVELVGADSPAEIHICFSTEAADLERRFRAAKSLLPPDGAIWVSWPKRSSKVSTDITEDTCRELFLPTGMVDNKVCAIDDVWSGLRFVVRKENRPDWLQIRAR